MRIALVSHCNFLGNSAMHVFSMAKELTLLGHEVVVLIPDNLKSIERHGTPNFPVLLYEDALSGDFPFRGPRSLDLIHCWTPREHVRKFVLKMVDLYECPYVLHMEDNEEQILADELKGFKYKDLAALPLPYLDAITNPYRSHPKYYVEFANKAAGYTCLMDRLLEFKPDHVPGTVFWAGFDPEFENLPKKAREARARYGITEDEIIVLYSGNTHLSTAHDISNLYLAISYLRNRGINIRLLRTGWSYAATEVLKNPKVKEASIELGFVDRSEIPTLVGLSDILVQPGKSDEFNDYRFPSKLPEYLVSGKPVILPASNIGHELTDGIHALKLHDGTLVELISKIEQLISKPELSKSLGKESRSFALEHLRWSTSAKIADDLYKKIVRKKETGPAKKLRKPKTRKVSAPLEEANPSQQLDGDNPVKLIAFYLPQFHPIDENNEWWGKGFTEWANVSRAKPQMFAHRQPRLPTELGYYDLRVKEVMHEQAKLAVEYGIGGFCFYIYWFEGRRLLEKPVDIWLKQGPDFPFCICWANENWSRRWDGSDSELLVSQDYGAGFEERFIVDMLPILTDPRYIKVDGAPLLPIYRVSEFPDPVASAKALRAAAAKHGIPKLHLTIMQSFGLSDPRPYGFDAAIEFSPPHVGRLLLNPQHIGGVYDDFKGYVEDYVGVAAQSINAPPTDYVRYRGCFPMWDNTARRKNRGHVLVNDSPKAYARWLRFQVHEAMLRRNQIEPLVFINAWNEWAEGAYLEPDESGGRALLEITRAALVHGVIDCAQGGADDERERFFTNFTSRIPKFQ